MTTTANSSHGPGAIPLGISLRRDLPLHAQAGLHSHVSFGGRLAVSLSSDSLDRHFTYFYLTPATRSASTVSPPQAHGVCALQTYCSMGTTLTPHHRLRPAQ